MFVYDSVFSSQAKCLNKYVLKHKILIKMGFNCMSHWTFGKNMDLVQYRKIKPEN
jgi:hypothetical protein